MLRRQRDSPSTGSRSLESDVDRHLSQRRRRQGLHRQLQRLLRQDDRGRCLCNSNVRERPGYRMGVHNDINWCMANTQSMYHCTVSVIVGVAGKG